MIKVNNLYFKYDEDSSKNALNGVSLEINKGEFVAVLGSNGCGKSTLAKHFNSILIPTDGQVLIDGMDTKDYNNTLKIRQNVGMVFQNPDNQIVATIVEEDVAFALENLGVKPDEIRRRIDDAMEKTGVMKFKDKAPHQLSGGQKQRVAIAGIVAMRPDYIVLDEPTAMLDPEGRRKVLKTIKYLNEEFNITVILITHYMDEAALADRVIVMNEGKILLDENPKEVFSKVELIKSLSLDVPQTSEIAYELSKIGFNLSAKAISIEESAQQLYDFLKEK